MLHECYAMYDLLLPYALKAAPVLGATAALAQQLSAASLHSPRLRHSVDAAATASSAPHASCTTRFIGALV